MTSELRDVENAMIKIGVFLKPCFKTQAEGEPYCLALIISGVITHSVKEINFSLPPLEARELLASRKLIN